MFIVFIKKMAGLFFVLALGACASHLDIDRAVVNYGQGNLYEAKRELLPLANMGIPEAKLRLADVLVKEGGSEQWDEAERLYLSVVDDEPKVQTRLAKLYRQRISGGESEYFYKATQRYSSAVKQGDVEAAKSLIELYLNYPAFLSESTPIESWIVMVSVHNANLAHYYSAHAAWIASPTLLTSTDVRRRCEPIRWEITPCLELLSDVAISLEDENAVDKLTAEVSEAFRESRVDTEFVYQFAKYLEKISARNSAQGRALYLLIIDQHPKAAVAYTAQVLKHAIAVDTKDLVLPVLMRQGSEGDVEANYLLGKLYFDGKWVIQNPLSAKEYFSKAASDIIGAEIALGLLYLDGWLGDPDFEKALSHLLSAARRGSDTADRMLAEMYWRQRGVKRNEVYAYSFAKLATIKDSERSLLLFAEISVNLPDTVKSTAERIFASEVAVRKNYVRYSDNVLSQIKPVTDEHE